MSRWNAGEWLLAVLMLVLFVVAVITLVRLTWVSPEVKEDLGTPSPAGRVMTFTPAVTEVAFRATPTATSLPPLVLDPVLLNTPAVTRVTHTPTPMPTVRPTPSRQPIQKG